jgi:hypothetical protein
MSSRNANPKKQNMGIAHLLPNQNLHVYPGLQSLVDRCRRLVQHSPGAQPAWLTRQSEQSPVSNLPRVQDEMIPRNEDRELKRSL